jgi:hypothetical protein
MKRTRAVAVIIQAVSAAFMGAPAGFFSSAQKSGICLQLKASLGAKRAQRGSNMRIAQYWGGIFMIC